MIPVPDPVFEASARLTNEIGLHARPSVQLTRLAKGFEATVEFALSPQGPWVDAKSPVKVMRARACRGTTLYFRSVGRDAPEAVRALADLVQREFDEAP